jgi:ATP-dependent DNA helicase RecG
MARFLQLCPSQPTAAQRRVIDDIARRSRHGQTDAAPGAGRRGLRQDVVAAAAALIAIASGLPGRGHGAHGTARRAAPAEFRRLVQRPRYRAGLAGRQRQGQKRSDALEAIGGGEAGLVIGTHALFQEGVAFARLGLVIVDEQHRFGVHQRLALSEKSGGDWRAHQLIMTATPIPRTLSMVAYADLDCSVIDELPPGAPARGHRAHRQPAPRRGHRAGRRNACREGRQVYWVCTLIEDSDCAAGPGGGIHLRGTRSALQGMSRGTRARPHEAREKDAVMSGLQGRRYRCWSPPR